MLVGAGAGLEEEGAGKNRLKRSRVLVKGGRGREVSTKHWERLASCQRSSEEEAKERDRTRRKGGREEGMEWKELGRLRDEVLKGEVP